MSDCFEQVRPYLSEPRYHRLKFISGTQTLQEQERLEAPTTGPVQQYLQQKKESMQKVALPKSLKMYPLERATLGVPVPKQVKKGLPEQATLGKPASNGVKKGLPEQATFKVSTPPDTNRKLSEQETMKIAVYPARKAQLFEQDTGKVPTSPDRRHELQEKETLRVVTLNGAKQREIVLNPLPSEARQQGKVGLDGRRSGATSSGTDDFDEYDTVPMMVLKGISKQQSSPQPVMKSEVTHAAGSAAYVGIGNIGGTILKYGGNLVIQRGLGVVAFGLYTLGMSVVNLVTAIFNLGLDDAMVRYTSIYKAKQKTRTLRGLTIFCTGLAGISGVLGALFILFYAPSLAAAKHSPELLPAMQIMSAMVPLTCLQTIWISGLQGFKEFKWRVLLQRILMPFILIFLLLGALIFFHNLEAIVIATLIYALLGAALSLYFFFRRVSGFMKPEPEAYEVREWMAFAAPNFLTSIIDTVLESVDTLLLAYFAISPAALGQYGAAIKISGFIIMPQASFNAMFAPTIAELHSQGERQKLEAMFKVVTKWVITFSLPIFWIVTLFSTALLSIGGKDFSPAWPLVVAFALGSMVNVGTGSVGYILLMTGHTRISFLNSLTAIIVNIVVGVILAPRYGAMGVAIATGLAVAVANVMRLLQVRLLLKMQPYRLDVLKPLGAGFISALLTGALLYLLSLAHLSLGVGDFLELCLVPVFLASYMGLLILFKISPEDQIVLDMLRKKFQRSKNKN